MSSAGFNSLAPNEMTSSRADWTLSTYKSMWICCGVPSGHSEEHDWARAGRPDALRRRRVRVRYCNVYDYFATLTWTVVRVRGVLREGRDGREGLP